ncbi:hypothetical protein BC332_01306 [Capsicum chinense]|nr:hypothetical protein BC332_01306 [Capsicum chinense]
MPDNFIPQEQLSAQRSSGDLEEYSATLFGDEVYVPPIDNYDSIEQQYSATELPQCNRRELLPGAHAFEPCKQPLAEM